MLILGKAPARHLQRLHEHPDERSHHRQGAAALYCTVTGDYAAHECEQGQPEIDGHRHQRKREWRRCRGVKARYMPHHFGKPGNDWLLLAWILDPCLEGAGLRLGKSEALDAGLLVIAIVRFPWLGWRWPRWKDRDARH